MTQIADESVYDQTYRHYLDQLKNNPLKEKADVLGITVRRRYRGGALFQSSDPLDARRAVG